MENDNRQDALQDPNVEKKRAQNPAIKDKVSFTFSWIAIVFRGIVGTFICWFVFTQTHRIEDENNLGRFLVLAKSTDKVIQINIDDTIKNLNTLGMLYSYENALDSELITRLVDEKLRVNPYVKKISWLKKNSTLSSSLPPSLIAIYEQAISNNEIQAAAIKDNDTIDGRPRSLIHLFIPAMKGREVLGAIWSVIDLGDLVQDSLDKDLKTAMNVFVFEKKQGQSKLLYFYNAEMTKKIVLKNKREELQLSKFQDDKQIHFGPLGLDVVFNATQEYSAYTWQAAIAAGIGTFLTTFIVVSAWILLEIEKRQFSNVLHQEHVHELEGTVDQLETAKNRLVAQENLASLGGLTAGIAHEIKNPLNFINNFSLLSIDLVEEINKYLLTHKDQISDKDALMMKDVIKTLSNNINTIHEQGKKADNTIQRMLAHSRGKPGEWAKTDIHKILDEYINFSFHGMRAKNAAFKCRIEKEFDESVKEIEVVTNDISRVLLNLLNNAFQAIEERLKKAEPGYEPKVTIKTRNVGNYLRIRIRDNGLGISEENKSKIFTPFFTTKPTGVGTGLGLSLSYNIIVREHSGSLTYDTKENEFCEFIVTIPLQPKKEKESITA